MQLHIVFGLFAIITLLPHADARISSMDSSNSASKLSAWTSSLLCSSAAVGPPQSCSPNIEDNNGYLDFRMGAQYRTSIPYNVELATVQAASLMRSSWLQPLYARLSVIAASAALCDNAVVAGFGNQLSDPLVSTSFSPWNAGMCNISSLDRALALASVSYKGWSPARITSYISMRSGSSRVHAADELRVQPSFDARLLPIASVAHGPRMFVFLIDGSFSSDSNALRLLIQASIRLVNGRDRVQMVWATAAGPALPLCRESLTVALATSEFKNCLIKMSRDMEFSGLAQLTRSVSIAEEIVSAYDGARKAELIIFASSSSPAFPFKDLYQGVGCLGRSSFSITACPYRSMFAVNSSSSSVQSPSLIVHSVILTPKTSTRYPEITCRTTGASVFIESGVCRSRFKCTSALSPIFMAVSRAFVDDSGSSPSWLPADEKCSLGLASALPLSCGPTLSFSSYVSNSSETNVVMGISSAELHPTELHDVLRDAAANVSLSIHGLTTNNVELLLVHISSGLVLSSSRLSTLSPNKDAIWVQDSHLDVSGGLLENGFKNFLKCCSGTECRCPSGQPNQVNLRDIAAKYQIPLQISNVQNVTCSSARPGVVACSVQLDSQLALIVIAQGRRTVSSSQVLMSGEKMPNFADFPISAVPATVAALAACPSNLALQQAAQLMGVRSACSYMFRSDSSVRFCRGNISLHFAPCSWRSSLKAVQGLDASSSQHVQKFISGLESSFLLPFSGLHAFAIVGSAISNGLIQTSKAPSNDLLSVFFGYRQGVFASTPARAVPPAFDHSLMDWFVSCASIPYSIANSNDASSFPVRFVILPLRQSFAALSLQRMLPPVIVIARPAFYAPSVSEESDNDNFVGVFGVEVDIPSFGSVLNQNEICRLDSSNCIIFDHQGWIIMDKYLQDPLTALSVIQQQHLSENDSIDPDFQRPLRLHLSRQYSTLCRELIARGIAVSGSTSDRLGGDLLVESTFFRVSLPSLPVVFELVDEGATVSISQVPWSNAVFIILASSSAYTSHLASGFGCGLSLSLDRLQPVDLLIGGSVTVPQTILRQVVARNPYPREMAALALPWSSHWTPTTEKFPQLPQNFGADAATQYYSETYISDNADFYTGTRDFFTIHACDTFAFPISVILAAVFAMFGLLMVLTLLFKHFQAVRRLFDVSVHMSLEPGNLSYSLYLLSKVEAAQRAVSGITIFDPILHIRSPPEKTAAISSNDPAEIKPPVSAKLPDWEREGRLWNALEVKLSTAIDESEYSAALKELCSVSVMSSFMNASLLLSSLSDYNNASRAQIWPCIDLVKDGASVVSTRLQRLEMMGVVLVSIQSMIEKLQLHAEKSASFHAEMFKASSVNGLEFLQRHYSDVVSPQLWNARNVQVARRLVNDSIAISPSSDSALESSRQNESNVESEDAPAEQGLPCFSGVDDLSLESARSSSSQAGGYFVDPSVIVIPSGSIGSAAIPLRLNVAGRHEQQASILRRAYLGRLHREIQGDTPSSYMPAENWALTALREHASQCGRAHSDDPDQLLPDIEMHLQRPSPAAIKHSGLGRHRVRRDQDTESEFGISNFKLSGDVVQSNSGLGAALLSVLNDIVAHDGNQIQELHQHDLDTASCNHDMNEELEVNMFDEGLTINPALEKGTTALEKGMPFNSDFEFESPTGASVASLQIEDLSQNNIVSGDSLVSERSNGVSVPHQNFQASQHMMMTDHQNFQASQKMMMTDHPGDVAPPTLGVATPRRAKVIQTGQISQHETHVARKPSQSEKYLENFGEMDM